MSLLAVLVAMALLGLAAWGVGIPVHAWVVSRETIRLGTLVGAGAALAASAIFYTTAVIVIRLVLAP